MDFLQEQALLYSSQRYENIYFHFNEAYGIKYHEFFLLCATIGFKNNRLEAFTKKGREFRTNYFNTKQKVSFYTMLLCDNELGRDLEAFSDPEFISMARKKIQFYAEGGMSILVESVFKSRFDGHYLDETYTDYDVDVLMYINDQATTVPF